MVELTRILYCCSGGNKRKGAIATYLSPFHPDFLDWLDCRKSHGDEKRRFRNLFYDAWVPDLFMRRVLAKGKWSFFCPDRAPGLYNVWGKEFDTLYERYEKEG